MLKCTHDSGELIIVRDKTKLDIEAARKKIKSLKHNYFWGLRVWVYKNVKPRIIAEKYMDDNANIWGHSSLYQEENHKEPEWLIDYKFHL